MAEPIVHGGSPVMAIQLLGDLDRLRLVLDNMPDETIMKTLEQSRGKGRNDYPVRAMWNSILAGIVIEGHEILKQMDCRQTELLNSAERRLQLQRQRVLLLPGNKNAARNTIRGMSKMKMRCGLALCVMLAMALGRIKENQPEKMRSLVAGRYAYLDNLPKCLFTEPNLWITGFVRSFLVTLWLLLIFKWICILQMS